MGRQVGKGTRVLFAVGTKTPHCNCRESNERYFKRKIKRTYANEVMGCADVPIFDELALDDCCPYCGHYVFLKTFLPDEITAPNSGKDARPIVGVDPTTGSVEQTFPSKAAAKKAGMSNVYGALKDTSRTAYGLKWRYAE